jgi:hypothetical protein
MGGSSGIVDVYGLSGSALLTNYSHSLNPQANQYDNKQLGDKAKQNGEVVNTCAWYVVYLFPVFLATDVHTSIHIQDF